MRKLTLRDLLATPIIAAVVVPFVGYSVRGSRPFVQDPRGMTGDFREPVIWLLLVIIARGITESSASCCSTRTSSSTATPKPARGMSCR